MDGLECGTGVSVVDYPPMCLSCELGFDRFLGTCGSEYCFASEMNVTVLPYMH